MVAPVVMGADYYVSNTGSGSACTDGAPCLPATVSALTLNAGDRVYFKAGTYTLAQVVTESGGSGNHIQYISQTPLTALVTGGTLPTSYQYYTFDGFYVNGSSSLTGLTISNDNITVQNCEIAGVDVSVGDNACSEDGVAVSGAGITISDNSDNITVTGNIIHGFNDSAINTPCTGTVISITENLFRNNFGSCLSFNNTSGTVTFNNNVCWNIPNHIMEIGNSCSGSVPPTSTLNMSGNIIVAGQEAWEGYSGGTITATNNTWYQLAVSASCAIEGGGMGFKNRLSSGIPLATGPFTFKNNIYASDRENDRDSTWYAFSSPLAYGTLFTASNYNWMWRQNCLTFGSCSTIATSDYRWYNLDGSSTITNLAAWQALSGFDLNSNQGNPNFTNPVLEPDPTTIAEARLRLTPLAGSSVCTAGEGGTYVGAVACATSGPDSTPPAAVTNLSVTSCTSSSCTLSWTAPGDDGTSGTATSYDIRYSTSPIISTNFSAAPQATGEPTPSLAGTTQTFILSGLTSNTTYHFALKTSDEVPNPSAISNVPSSTTAVTGGGIACTEAAFEAALAACVNGQTITFNCAATNIQLTASRFSSRILSCSNVTIDGENKITFSMNPAWWDVSPSFCADGDCDDGTDSTPSDDTDDVPENCPTVNDGGSDMWALYITGAGSQLKNATVRYFMEGIRLHAAGATLDNVTVEYPGDDGASNVTGANVIVRNSTFRNACDKNIQMYGDEPLGGASYDFQVIDSTFENNVSALRTTGPGRFYIEGSLFRDVNAPSTLFRSNGPFFQDTDVLGAGNASAVYWKDNTVSDVRRGVRVSGVTHFISLGGNVYTGNDIRGLVVYTQARALIQGDSFTTNGGVSTGESCPAEGGIGVCNTATVDAGGGSQTLDGATRVSTGGNTFTGNIASTAASMNFDNRTATEQKAENNCWNDTNPADEISGSVDYISINPLCAGSSRLVGTGVTMRGVEVR